MPPPYYSSSIFLFIWKGKEEELTARHNVLGIYGFPLFRITILKIRYRPKDRRGFDFTCEAVTRKTIGKCMQILFNTQGILL